MSMVTKSLLQNHVAKYQFYPLNVFEDEEFAGLFELYYKGFCPPPPWNDKENIQSIPNISLDLKFTINISISTKYHL